MNILAGITLTEGIDVNAAAAAAGAAAAAVGGPVPLDRKGRPCNYPCPACPRRFAFQCRLAAHLRCHTNIRPFTCIDCGRAFTQRGYLVRHAAVHKLDRPFSCGLCDRSYKHYGSLVNHRRTHNKGVGLTNTNILSNVTANLGVLSSLEEVVSGSLVHSLNKPNSTANLPLHHQQQASTTTITLLPVTKVEEILPGDLNGPAVGSIQSMPLSSVVCASGPSVLTVSENHDQQKNSESQPPAPPHQLTATAVWPILAAGSTINNINTNTTNNNNDLSHTSTIHQQNRQSMVSGSHFSTITISPTQLSQSSQTTTHHHQSSNPSTLLSNAMVNSTPTFLTVPLFSQQSDTGGGQAVVVNGQLPSHSQHIFHTSTSSDSVAQLHHLQQQLSSNSNDHNNIQTQAQIINSIVAGDANSAPVLHVLQPSPSIFFSPYYLPHSAASQM